MLRNLFLSFLCLLTVSCATVGEQTRAIVTSPPDVPPQSQVPNVPFINQAAGFCGPSALTMVMQWAGSDVTIQQITPEVYTPEKKGSLQLDLVSASRRHGLLAVPIEGMSNLLKELAAGYPVIVLENLGFSWYPQWHYDVVTGYDLKEQEFVMHSGETSNKRQSMNYFERGWKLGNYWGLVVLPPHQLSVTADELAHLQAAVGLEQAEFPEAAEQVYRNIVRRWPQSLASRIGLGNIAYKKKDYVAAVKVLTEATRIHPESQAAKHNLEVAQSALRSQKTKER